MGVTGAEITTGRDGLQARMEIVPLNALSIMTLDGSFDRTARNQAAIKADGSDALCLVMNRGPEPIRFFQRDREVLVEAGRATLFSEGMVGRFETPGQTRTAIFRLPRRALVSAIRHPEDALGQVISSTSEPLRMLDSYARTMMAAGGINDPATAQSIGGHLTDLIGLALGPGGDAAEMARGGGLRAGRVHTVLGEIEAGYQDAAFSIHQVAAKQCVTPRYLQGLLQETGVGFGERVLELPLQNAWRLLSHWRHADRKVTDIAFTSGFNDVSYFHRSFRARFGMTPGDARAVGLSGEQDVRQRA